jgi:hypothetical protein
MVNFVQYLPVTGGHPHIKATVFQDYNLLDLHQRTGIWSLVLEIFSTHPLKFMKYARKGLMHGEPPK